MRVCSLILGLAMQPDPGALAPLYRENAARAEKQFGREDARARQACRDLGLFLARYGSKEEAERVLRRCAETASDYAQLAELVTGSQASAFYRIALLKEEQASGQSHPKVAVRLNDLALTLPPREAEPLLRRALAVNEEALGAAHLETAATLNNLADALATLRRFKEAEPYAKRSFEIFRARLGPESERTRIAADNLAAIQRVLRSSPR